MQRLHCAVRRQTVRARRLKGITAGPFPKSFSQKFESDADFDNKWHSRYSPLPIRCYPHESLVAGQAEFLQPCAELGYESVAEPNAPGAVEAGRLPVNSMARVRQGTALAYLAAVRGAPT